MPNHPTPQENGLKTFLVSGYFLEEEQDFIAITKAKTKKEAREIVKAQLTEDEHGAKEYKIDKANEIKEDDKGLLTIIYSYHNPRSYIIKLA